MYEQPLTQRQQKTHMAFINAFVTLVMERGFDRISVTDIANEADYGRWVFYQYFRNKEDVAWASFVYWMTNLDQYMVEAVKHLPFPEREYQSWRILFHAFEKQRDFFMRLDSVLVSPRWEQAKEFATQQFLQHLVDGTFTLMEGVRPEIAARLYVSAFGDLLQYWGAHPELGDADSIADEFFIFIFKQPPPQK